MLLVSTARKHSPTEGEKEKYGTSSKKNVTDAEQNPLLQNLMSEAKCQIANTHIINGCNCSSDRLGFTTALTHVLTFASQ